MVFKYQLINGEILEKDAARIPLNDLGMLRSYSIFDFFRILGGKPLFIEDHLDRLLRSSKAMDLALRWDKPAINAICRQLIRKNEVSDAGLRVVVTGGYAEDGYTPSQPNIYMMLHDLPKYDETLFMQGAKLISTPYMRDMPSVKTTIYIHSIQYKRKMQEQGAVEILYLWQGNVKECSRSNIFFVDAVGNVVTPDDGILNGITRKQVLAIAQEQYNVELRPVHYDEIRDMREAFITSSTMGVMPVIRIDNITVGDGNVGPVTRSLRDGFNKCVEDYLGSH